MMIRHFARALHIGRIVPEIEPDLAQKIADEALNPKVLVTRRNIGFVHMPAQLQTLAEARLRHYSDKQFRAEAKELIRIMQNLKLPDDEHSIRVKKADLRTELEIRDKIKSRPEYDPSDFRIKEDDWAARDELTGLINGTIGERRRDWHYYEYDERASNMYMATRLPPNYACIRTVMKEIKDLVPNFQPKSVLDFGSGMGTTIWAVNETWPNTVSEFMNIDISKEQQHLCEDLLRGGKEFGEMLPGVFHRQYLPSSTKVKYDLVVSAFSMLELPNSELRANTIENLWHKTNDMLVIIERGNRGGFATINEARHFILDLTGHDVTKKLIFCPESQPAVRRTIPDSHVVAPCPHEYACPRAMMSSKKNMDVCRFKVFYEPLEIGQKTTGLLPEEFSYTVIRKKPHPSYLGEDTPRWPRIVEKRLHSKNQITHKICCPNGHLAETVITKKKYGIPSYALAKSCDWGDILPIKVKDTYISRNTKSK